MIYRLASGTDAGFHFIYDPKALAYLRGKRKEEFANILLTGKAEDGSVLEYNVAGDGGAHYRVYVDEAIPEEWAKNASATTNDLLLRVPSGTLVACGAEYVGDAKEIKQAIEGRRDFGPMVSKIKISPGNYLVDAYELNWDWDGVIAPVMRSELGKPFMRERYLGPSLGCGLVGTVLGAVGTVVSTIAVGWSWNNFYWVGVPLALLLAIAYLFKFLIPDDYWKRKDEIAARYPPNVLVMRRLPDGEDLSPYKGGGFGFAYRENEVRKRGKVS